MKRNDLEIKMNINGEWKTLMVSPNERLIDTLRNQLSLTGTKEGCAEGECGACTINMNKKAVLACLVLSVQADGAHILTIEGLQNAGKLHPIQSSFLTEFAVQCGYCTPGMIMAGHALINQNPDPDEETVKECISNNLCRCTGYENPVKGIMKSAKIMKEKPHHG